MTVLTHQEKEMQIKERGNKFQLLRYNGYSKDKKRATVEVAGSIDKNATYIPPELAAKLTDDEIAQLSVITKENAAREENLLGDSYLQTLPRVLSKAQSSLERGVNPTDAQAIFEAIKNFKRAMKERGFEPPKSPKREPKQAPGQQSFLPGEQPAATTS